MHEHGFMNFRSTMVNLTTSTFLELSTTILPNITRDGEKIFFSWYDYLLFIIMLMISGGIGIYFGCFGKKQATAKEYLMGGKEMKVLPIAISIVASHTSGITLLAVPADVYVFGATYWLGTISLLIVCLITIFVFLPVFHHLQLTSTYEYLGRRFDKRTRKCSSFLFAVSLMVHLPIVIYIPALAFSAATGLNVHVITPIVCTVCIFYTTLGGLKALVWSDTLQFTVTVGAMTTVLVLGIKATGGFAAVWQKAVEGGRLDIFGFSMDMTQRDSFWAIIIGLTIHWISHISVNQGCMQKFLSVATLNKSKLAVIYFTIGMSIMKTLSVLSGLIIFARYSDCDPFSTGKVERNDQLLPHYVMDIAGSIPGLSGLFIAGVVSASLSTLSGNLNCVAGTIYEDFLKGFLERKGPHRNAGFTLKVIVVIAGIVSTLLVYIVENLGGLLSLAIGVGSVSHGPLLGMFVIGMLFPRANEKGAFYGALSAMVSMATIIFGANYYKSQKLLRYPHKPISIDGCDFVNSTLRDAFNSRRADHGGEVFFLFRISFYWYTMIGAVITIIVGLAISYMTNKNDPPISRELLSPVIHSFVPEDTKDCRKGDIEYYSVKEAMEILESDSIRRESFIKAAMRKASYCSEVFDD